MLYPRVNDAYKWQIPVFLCIIEAVAYDKLIRYHESGIVDIHIGYPPVGLIQQSAKLKLGGSSLLKDLQEICSWSFRYL